MAEDYQRVNQSLPGPRHPLHRWLWIVACALLMPSTGVAQNDTSTQNEVGLVGITQVQFGNEIRIYSVEVVDNADGFITVELGKTTVGAPVNAGIQLTISDLTTATGLVSADFTDLRLYRSADAILDGSDTFMSSVSSVNIGTITELDATGAGVDRLIPEAGSIFFIVSARVAGTAVGGHAFRVGAANLNIGVEESGVGAAPGVVGNQVLADDASHIVFGGGPAKTGGGAAVTIPFGGEKAILCLLVGSGAYVLSRRQVKASATESPER